MPETSVPPVYRLSRSILLVRIVRIMHYSTSFPFICSNYEHQQHDFEAVHHLLCHLLAQARRPLPHANSSEERLQMKQEQQKIRVSMCVYRLTCHFCMCHKFVLVLLQRGLHIVGRCKRFIIRPGKLDYLLLIHKNLDFHAGGRFFSLFIIKQNVPYQVFCCS